MILPNVHTWSTQRRFGLNYACPPLMFLSLSDIVSLLSFKSHIMFCLWCSKALSIGSSPCQPYSIYFSNTFTIHTTPFIQRLGAYSFLHIRVVFTQHNHHGKIPSPLCFMISSQNFVRFCCLSSLEFSYRLFFFFSCELSLKPA